MRCRQRPARSNVPVRALRAWMAAAVLGAATTAGAQGPASSPDPALVIQQGARVYEREGCPLCHRIGAVGGTVGPALDAIGRRRPDAEWYVRVLRDPAAVVPDAKMPPFGQLPEPQLQALAAYLLSLR